MCAENESETPRIQWQHSNRAYRIRCGVPLTPQYPDSGRARRVSLDQGDKHFSAKSPEELILQQLGYELPISYLEFWIKGLPVPDRPAALLFNDLNQLTAFEQADWTITLSDLRDYGADTATQGRHHAQ